MIFYKNNLIDDIERNDETIKRLEERIIKLKKYRKGLELAKSNVEQIIKNETYG